MANNNNLGNDYYAMLIAEAEAAEAAGQGRNERQAAINNAVAAARTAFNRNFRNEAAAVTNNAQQQEQYMNLMIQESKNSRQVAKASANAALYNEAKAVLLSEDKKLRQSVLKEVALDDIIIEERIKLAHAKTDEERRASATKIYNAEKLKGELSDARQMNRGASAEQNARYANLTRNINFNVIPYSLYPRLRNNNASRTANNQGKAATKIAAFKRGYTTRKQYKPQLNALRAVREAEKAKQMEALPMVPMEQFEAPKPKGHVVGGPNAAPAPTSAAERRRLMAEAAAKRFAKKPNQGGKRKTQRRR